MTVTAIRQPFSPFLGLQASLPARGGVCFLLGILANIFILDAPAGWGWALIHLVAVLAMAAFTPKLLSQRLGAMVWLLMMGLGVALWIQPNPWAVMLSDIGWVLLILLAARVDFNSPVAIGVHGMLVVLIGWIRPFVDLAHVVKVWQKVPHRVRCHLLWLMPVVLTLVFAALFFQANPVIEKWLEEVDWALIFSWFNIPRILYLLVVMVCGWMILRPRVFPIRLKSTAPARTAYQDSSSENSLFAVFFSPMSLIISLAIFNGLFALQNGLDAAFLWGGQALPDGLTYADYAHRGAYPLIATALLAGAFVMFIMSPGSEREGHPVIRGLVLAWLAQNVLLTVSSIWRLLIYMEVYSLTHWRLAALLWMGLVALGLVFLLVRVLAGYGNFWLVKVNLLSLFALLYACSFINLNAVIADYNVEHCLEATGKGTGLDWVYVRDELGVDALPALIRMSADPNVRRDFRQVLASEINLLSHDLNQALSDWRGWTWNRAEIRAALTAHTIAQEPGKIESPDPAAPMADGWRWSSSAPVQEQTVYEPTHSRR